MNKPYRVAKNDYDKIYVASDFHYNHQRDFLWKPRGFNSYQEHDAFIAAQCDTLTADDLLIYLGDYSLNTTDEATLELLRRTKARTFYIFGNHEGFHSRFYRESLHTYFRSMHNTAAVRGGLALDHASLFGENFISDYPFQIFPFSVNKFTKHGFPGLRHKIRTDDSTPYITYFGEEGYFRIGNHSFFCRHMAPLIWDKMKYDTEFAICGHSHGNLACGKPEAMEGKLLDVGVDNAIKYNGTAFFTVEDIIDIMSTKSIKIHDHHGDEHI